MSRKRSDSKRLVQRGGVVSRKREPDQIKRPSKKTKTGSTSDEHLEEVSAYQTHTKLTNDFLERSKMRLLSCTRARLTARTHKISGENPRAGQQDATCSLSRNVGNDERPILRNQTSATGRAVAAEEHVISLAQAKSTRKTQKRVLFLNNEVSLTKVDNGKRVTAPPTQRKTKKHPSQANSSNLKTRVRSSNSNTKKKEDVESKPMKSTGPEQVKGLSADEKNTTKDCQLTSRRSSNVILVLCNGQRKCKKEGCYKAASQHGLCPTHGGQKKCRTQGCKNFSFSNGLCEVHDGGKPRTKGETDHSTAEPNEGSSKSSIPVQMPSLASHDNPRNRTANTDSSRTTSTTKNRPKLQTRKKLLKTSTSDAWRTSDLPNLFRSASSQRAPAMNVKQETVDSTVQEEKPPVPKRQKTTGSRGGKANSVCKVLCCKESVASEGFCQTHSKRKRCQHEGCNNLAPKNALSDLCYRHGGRMKCQIKDCMKNAHYWKLCAKHGGRSTCRNEGCDRAVYTRGLCSKDYREIQDPKFSDSGRARVKKEADRV